MKANAQAAKVVNKIQTRKEKALKTSSLKQIEYHRLNKKPPFISSKAAFHEVKDGFLHGEKPLFAKRKAANRLE